MAFSKSWNYSRWLPIVLLTIVCVALFMIPAYFIRPFKQQSVGGLRLAIFVKQIAPLLTLVGAAGVLLLGIQRWRETSWLPRVGLALAILLSTAAAVMTRLNYFEWMFHPIPSARFLTASDTHLKDAEMVMAVRFGGEARAYPIVQMAYHHVLNDTVGEVPIVVTY